MLGSRTGLNADKTARLLLEERQHQAALQLTTNHSLTRGINTMDLKHVLREIKTDRDNFVHRTAPFLAVIVAWLLAGAALTQAFQHPTKNRAINLGFALLLVISVAFVLWL